MAVQVHATGYWQGRQRDVHTPARQVVTPSGTIIRGRFPSVTARRMVSFEQLLERDALYLFDFAPQVVGIREQPFKLNYMMDKKVRRYTPDFALTMRDGSILIVEVKPIRSLAEPALQEQHRYIRDAMQRQGHDFIVLSRKVIRAPHRLNNLKKLHRHLRQSISTEDRLARLRLFSLFGQNGQTTKKQLEQTLGNSGVVMRLVAHGLVSCDLDQLITPDTVITLLEQEVDYVFIDSL